MNTKKNNMNLMIAFGILIIAAILTYILKLVVEYNNLQKPPDLPQSVVDTINPILSHF